MLPLRLINFKKQKCYQNKLKFDGVYLRSNLPEIKDGAYIINLDERKWKGTDWIALYMNGDNVTYFESFGVEYITKEIKKFVGKKIYLQNTSKGFNNV